MDESPTFPAGTTQEFPNRPAAKISALADNVAKLWFVVSKVFDASRA